jgi:glycerol-3-phosphate dehydrogenase
MYDVMASDRLSRRPGRRGRDPEAEEDWSPDRHRTISGEETLDLLPALDGRDPTSAYLFYDCQTDDVRLVLTVLGEAERFGTVCANRCEVTSLIEVEGRAAGVNCADRLGGGEFEVRADNVVNATGVWADRIRPEEIHAEEDRPHIRPSRGTHVTLRHDVLPVDAGVIVPAGGGRSIFVLPWLGRTLVGTTDNDYEGSLDHVPPSGEDVDYLLQACNRFFAIDLRPADLTGAYAGVRPLISSGDPKKSVDISRRAELYETSSGLVTITGGKLTTWRRMAKMAVDRIVEREAREAPCRTHEIPLGLPVQAAELEVPDGVELDSTAHLAARYGHAAHDVLDLVRADSALGARITPECPDLLGEVVQAVRQEQALTVGDVLLRRTRLGILDAPAVSSPAGEAARAVARVMANELGWEADRVGRELDAWGEEASAEGRVAA